MKRPRNSSRALSLFALVLTSPPSHRQFHLATAASLRATQSPAVDTESAGGISGGNSREDQRSSPFHRAAAASPPNQKNSLTVKLSTSSHPRSPHTATSSSSSSGTRITEDDAPEIPLIGIGVGNLPHNKIPYILASALSLSSNKNKKHQKSAVIDEDLNYRLIDTSHTDSALEVLVGRSLSRLSTSSSPPGGGNNKNLATAITAAAGNSNVYHVMIKVWHTHLGYERTFLSIEDSLSDIMPNGATTRKKGKASAQGSGNADASKNVGHNTNANNPDVRIHAILQYPRCYDSLFASESYLTSPNFPKKHTSCQAEEDSLDEATKNAGPSPLLDRESSWKRSYRALEELYHHGTLESIGVSNFGPADLDELFELATVGPHIYQGTLQTLLTQDAMVEELVKHGVHYQCYDVASAVVSGKEAAPRAYAKLERIGAKHGGMLDSDENNDGISGSGANEAYGYSAVQVVLGWLIHHRGVGVIPGTTNVRHLVENSPTSLGGMPHFSPREALDVETAIMAIVNGKDIVDEGTGSLHQFKDIVATEEIIDINGPYNRENTDNFSSDRGVVVTFFNTLPPGRHVRIFNVHKETGEQIQLSHSIPPGRSGHMIVNQDDVLIAYDGHGVAVKKFLVDELNGSLDFTVE